MKKIITTFLIFASYLLVAQTTCDSFLISFNQEVNDEQAICLDIADSLSYELLDTEKDNLLHIVGVTGDTLTTIIYDESTTEFFISSKYNQNHVFEIFSFFSFDENIHAEYELLKFYNESFREGSLSLLNNVTYGVLDTVTFEINLFTLNNVSTIDDVIFDVSTVNNLDRERCFYPVFSEPETLFEVNLSLISTPEVDTLRQTFDGEISESISNFQNDVIIETTNSFMSERITVITDRTLYENGLIKSFEDFENNEKETYSYDNEGRLEYYTVLNDFQDDSSVISYRADSILISVFRSGELSENQVATPVGNDGYWLRTRFNQNLYFKPTPEFLSTNLLIDQQDKFEIPNITFSLVDIFAKDSTVFTSFEEVSYSLAPRSIVGIPYQQISYLEHPFRGDTIILEEQNLVVSENDEYEEISSSTSFLTNELVDEFSAIIESLCSPVTSVNSSNDLLSFSVFPNPATDIIQINQAVEEVKIYSQLGQLMAEYSNSSIIYLNEFDSGVYVMHLIDKGQLQTVNIIKK